MVTLPVSEAIPINLCSSVISVRSVGRQRPFQVKSFRFTNNIIECQGTPRPLFRNDASGSSLIENNQLTNITDTTRYANKKTGQSVGLGAPLKFQCGVNSELGADGWKTSRK